MSYSLRQRIEIILLPVIIGALVLSAVLIYAGARKEMNELTDAQLVQLATVMLNLVRHELLEEQALRGPSTLVHDHPYPSEVLKKYEQIVAFQVWEGTNLLVRSEKAPVYPISDAERGFATRVVDGIPWRVYTLTDPEVGLRIMMGVSIERREELRDWFALRLLIPILVTLPLLAALIWWGVRRAMMPLVRLAGDVSKRQPQELAAIKSDEIPEEAKPLIDSLNALFRRVDYAFENERRFTADAAHELRTPLAGLKLQAQLALRGTDDNSRRAALNRLIQSVDRATHMVQQLLTLARLNPELDVSHSEDVDLTKVTEEVLADIEPHAYEKKIECNLNSANSTLVKGDPDWIAILVRNLVHNAIQYTPEGGLVEVTIDHHKDDVILRVADSGPGIPEEECERVFDRFFRRGEVDVPGCGLGLSIVKRIAEIHHATIQLGRSAYKGLQVDVHFGQVMPA